MDMDTVLSLLARHALTTIGGGIAATGWGAGLDNQTFVGAGMVFVGLLLSWWNKRGYALVEAELAKFKGVPK